jgi:hypothetical protein
MEKERKKNSLIGFPIQLITFRENLKVVAIDEWQQKLLNTLELSSFLLKSFFFVDDQVRNYYGGIS